MCSAIFWCSSALLLCLTSRLLVAHVYNILLQVVLIACAFPAAVHSSSSLLRMYTLPYGTYSSSNAWMVSLYVMHASTRVLVILVMCRVTLRRLDNQNDVMAPAAFVFGGWCVGRSGSQSVYLVGLLSGTATQESIDRIESWKPLTNKSTFSRRCSSHATMNWHLFITCMILQYFDTYYSIMYTYLVL